MDENTMTTTETVEQTSEDAFLAGWEDSDSPIEADQPEEEEETEEAPADNESEEEAKEEDTSPSDQKEEENPEPAAAPEAEEVKADAPKTWMLRHLDEQKEVGEQEMVALAQKGMDYDRIREKYDEAKPVMDLFREFAKQANLTVPEYVAHIRMQAKKAAGMNDADAKRAVELEDREAAVAQKEEAQKEAEKQQSAESQAKADADARRKADIAEFQKTFPDAAKEPDKIPKEVWDGVKSGLSLVAAYAKYQVEKAKADAAAAAKETAAVKQNQKNAGRSTGSMKSAGEEKRNRDPFLEGWNS